MTQPTPSAHGFESVDIGEPHHSIQDSQGTKATYVRISAQWVIEGRVMSGPDSQSLSRWGVRGGSADPNKDCAVNSLDLVLLLANWG
jgi:hypothetical protein